MTVFAKKVTVVEDSGISVYHVHAVGCADIERSAKYYAADQFDYDAGTTLEEIASDSFLDQVTDGTMTAEEAAREFKVFPCALSTQEVK